MESAISQSPALIDRLEAALAAAETELAARDVEIARLRHVRDEAETALTELDALLGAG